MDHWDARDTANAVAYALGEKSDSTGLDTQSAHANLARDVFAGLFSPARTGPRWQTPAVTSLATAAYEERLLPSGELEPARLAVLADALEEAGCTNAGLLAHLRSPGPHFRGCWALDLVRGKE